MADTFDRLKTALSDRYAIAAEIGAGGMATVYLAEDLKHHRKVAVKVLRPELAAILGAERFLKEIEVTANLQHPNILPLYDSGEADTFLFYVMPYIEGESLRDKLNREKQLGVEEAVEIAKSVAAALQFAHERDIIHRDIKPENILLQSGQALVADFGIALAVSHAGATRLTETGLSLGTPQYMSPEQAMGDREVDARSDVYSLAAMLYEMFVGDPPYTGSTAQAIVAKVITEKAVPITMHRDTVPRHVAAAIHKALAKLPADRFPDVTSFAEAMVRPSLADTEEYEILVSGATPQRAATAASGWRSYGFAAVAAVLGVFALWGWLRPPPTPSPSVTRFVIAPPQTDGVEQPFQFPPALSPDGKKSVYAVVRGSADDRGLYVRVTDQFETTPIPGTAGARYPFFSPDSRWVGFWADGALRKVPVDGGPVVLIAETDNDVFSASWGSNDTIVFEGLLRGLSQVAASGGTAELLTTLGLGAETDIGHHAPEVLPGGDAVLFTSGVGGGSSRIAVASMDTGEWHVLIEDGLGARYSPTGHVTFARLDGSLWAVQFDVERLQLAGEPALIMDRTVLVNPSRANAFYALADDGTLMFVGAGEAPAGELVWVDPDGVGTPLGFPSRQYRHPRLSPDGRQVAVTTVTGGGRDAIWVLDLDRITRTRFTAEGTINRWPVWTHDGTRIAFSSSRGSSTFDLFWKPVDGSGEARTLLASERLTVPFSWSADHQTLAYYEIRSGAADIWTLPSEGAPSPVVTSSFDNVAPMFSPDGRWLAYVSDESGQDQVYARPYPGAGATIPISRDGGIEPVWSRDGRALYYRNEDRMMVVSVGADETFGTPRVLFRQSYAISPIGRGNPNYDVAADGRFLMVRDRPGEGGVSPLYVVLNFFEELKAKVGN